MSLFLLKISRLFFSPLFFMSKAFSYLLDLHKLMYSLSKFHHFLSETFFSQKYLRKKYIFYFINLNFGIQVGINSKNMRIRASSFLPAATFYSHMLALIPRVT